MSAGPDASHPVKAPTRSIPVLLAALSALGPFSTDTMLPSMLEIGRAFHASPVAVQQILTAYMIPFAFMSLWHGAISDALGRRTVIVTGLVLYGLAAIGCALAQSLPALIAWRAVQGFVAGAGTVVGRAMVRDFYTGAKAQRLMATVSVVFSIAPIIGPVVGGWLHVWFGWRSAFWFLAGAAGVLVTWTSLALPETLPRTQRQPLHPVYLARTYTRVLTSRVFLAASLALALNFCGFFIYVMSAPMFLGRHLGLPETQFIWLFAQSSLGMMAGAWLARALAGRWDRWRTIGWGYAAMVAASVLNLAYHAVAPAAVPWSVLPLFLYNAGMALIMPSLTLVALDLFPQQRGLASSCQSFVQSAAGALLASLLAPLFWETPLRLASAQITLLALGAGAALAARRGSEPLTPPFVPAPKPARPFRMSSTLSSSPAPETESPASRPFPKATAETAISIAKAIGDELARTANERERAGDSPREFIQILRETELVNLLIPKRFGGLGGSFRQVAHVVLEISRGDASVGALLAFHYDVSSIPRLSDFKGGAEKIERESAAKRWFWANSLQGGFVKSFTALPLPGGRLLLNGRKEWSTGFSLADVAIVMAYREDINEVIFLKIPTDRKGLVFHDDWDHLGLRLAEIVTVDYVNVEVEAEEIIPSTHGERVRGFPPFYNSISSVFLNGATQLGATLGALERAREYTRTKTRPRGGLPTATVDPYILAGYGEFWIKLQAGLALLDRVAEQAQKAFDRRATLTSREIGEIGVQAAALRVFSAQAGLDITARIYDVTGAHATANLHGLDRHWRDVRILSARHPISYAIRAAGDFALNDVVNEQLAFIP